MVDNRQKEIVFEAARKSKTAAYLLWLFLGWFGAHRFYAGETRTGAAQALMTLSVVFFPFMLLWWLFDLFLVPGMVNERNMELIRELNTQRPRGYTSELRDARGEADEAVPAALDEAAFAPTPKLDGKRARMLEELRTLGHRKERRDPTYLYR